MKAKSSAAADGLKEILVDGLKDIVYAERALLKALPKMSNNATEPKLKAAIDDHIVITEGQVERLEQVFEILANPTAVKNVKP